MNKESCSIFEQLIKEINDCLEHECFLTALGMALTLPDICGKAAYPTDTVAGRYIKWTNEYISAYEKDDSPYGIDMLDDENDFDEDDVSTPLYRWDYLCLSNIGSSIGILKYIKVNEDIYSFDENSAIRPDECYQIHGSRLTNFTSGHVNSIHLGLYDKCFNFYEYNISFSIKELAPRDHPRENEKLLHFDTIDCVHNLYRPKQSFIGSFFHHRF